MIKKLTAAAILSAAIGNAAIAAPTPEPADSFSLIVAVVLERQTTGAISRLHGLKRQAAIHCANDVLRGLPGADKMYVRDGMSYAERRHRLGVVLRRDPGWRDRVAQSCGGIGVLS